MRYVNKNSFRKTKKTKMNVNILMMACTKNVRLLNHASAWINGWKPYSFWWECLKTNSKRRNLKFTNKKDQIQNKIWSFLFVNGLLSIFYLAISFLELLSKRSHNFWNQIYCQNQQKILNKFFAKKRIIDIAMIKSHIE